MAATVSAWSKPGAWALDAEENESELLQQRKEDDDHQSHGGETADFPSLAAASTTKAKKKKPQTLSLKEFAAHGVGVQQQKGLTPHELSALPTGPRQRTAEELDRNKLGGGFRSYGGGARDEQPRRQGSFNRDSITSRADETDDWGAGKKSSVNSGFDRRDRGERGGFRADEVDNWASNKSFVPSETRKYEKRGGGYGLESGNGGSDSSNWGKRKEEEGRRSGGAFDRESWGGKREEVSGGTRPKLNLQPRTLPVNDEQKGNATVKGKGSDPFGDARPREEVLKEKGQDWKEIEEKLESVKIGKEAISGGGGDGAKGSAFWRGGGAERAWRRPESADSHPQSAGETERGDAESCEDGEGRDVM